eukprot:13560214-Alexandrium_andersonii.AAC.1
MPYLRAATIWQRRKVMRSAPANVRELCAPKHGMTKPDEAKDGEGKLACSKNDMGQQRTQEQRGRGKSCHICEIKAMCRLRGNSNN